MDRPAKDRVPGADQPVILNSRSKDPILLAFSLPDVPQSGLGPQVQSRREFSLPADLNDHSELLNAPEFRIVTPGENRTMEIATKTGSSGLGGGFSLAQIVRSDAKTLRFAWTKEAKNHATLVEALRDAVLKLQTRDGRDVDVLLRSLTARDDGSVIRDEKPLIVWDNQPILFERLESRTRSVPWLPGPESLSGTRWKLVVRRWKAVISRPNPEGPNPLSCTIVTKPLEGIDRAPAVNLKHDLIPGEVAVEVGIDPASPGMLKLRIELDKDKVQEKRESRAARLQKLKQDTPKDKNDRQQDPLRYRRRRLEELNQTVEKSEGEIDELKQEVAELEAIYEINRVEDLLSKPARTELSLVIGLDLGGHSPLEIVKIGEMAK
jgi:hypothetical protein